MRKGNNAAAYATCVIFEKDNGNLHSITDAFRLSAKLTRNSWSRSGLLHRLKYHIRNINPGSRHILSSAQLHRDNFAKRYLDFKTIYNETLDSHHRAG